MFLRCLPALLLACCCIAPAPAVAREIFVNNLTGSDLSRGNLPDTTTSPRGGPVASIAKALRLAMPGDRIVLAASGQPYRESISLSGNRLSGWQGVPLTIRGNGAVLDGSAPVPDRAWEHYAGDTFRFRPARMAYQQLFLADRPAQRRPVAIGDTSVPELEPLEWCLVDGQIYFCVEEGKLPQDYQLTHAALPVGITLHQVRNVQIEDLTVQGFQLDGISADDGAFEVLLRRVTCRGNGRSGVSVGGSSRVRIEDSLLGDNGTAQLRTEGYSRTTVEDSHLLSNTAPAVVQDGGELTVDGGPWDEHVEREKP